jgi:hypothetical protein
MPAVGNPVRLIDAMHEQMLRFALYPSFEQQEGEESSAEPPSPE